MLSPRGSLAALADKEVERDLSFLEMAWQHRLLARLDAQALHTIEVHDVPAGLAIPIAHPKARDLVIIEEARVIGPASLLEMLLIPFKISKVKT